MPRDVEYNRVQWEQALQCRGVNSVRLLMRISAGHDADMAFQGLMAEPPYPPRAFVENWLVSHDESDRKIRRRLLWPILLVIVAAGILWAAITIGDFQMPTLLARIG
jgi:hypothetical protein